MKNQLCLFLVLVIFLEIQTKSVFEYAKFNNFKSFKLSLNENKEANVSEKALAKNVSEEKEKENKISPYKAALELSKNIQYAFGEFDLPKQLWYYQKRFSGNPIYTYSTIEQTSNYSSFKVPLELKELSIEIQLSYYFYGGGNNGNDYPGVELSVGIDGKKFSNFKQTSQEGNGWAFIKTIHLKGSSYNVTAGVHSLTYNARSTNGGWIWIGAYASSMILTMVGYPSS